jgi:hypothetical protein
MMRTKKRARRKSRTLERRTSTRRRGAQSKQRRRRRRRRWWRRRMRRMKYSYLGSRSVQGGRSRRAGRKGRRPRELACDRHKEARRQSAPRLVMMFMRRIEALGSKETPGREEPWRHFRSRLHTHPASLSCPSPSPHLTSLPARRPPIPSLAQAAAAAVAAAARGETVAAHTRTQTPRIRVAALAGLVCQST